MKINYDKKGIKLIGITFLLFVIINMWIKNSFSFLIIPFTIGVFIPYILMVILAFLFYLVKKRELYIFSDSRVVIILVLFEFFIIYDHLNNN
jgi:apolipoprotein N-acyltransferase